MSIEIKILKALYILEIVVGAIITAISTFYILIHSLTFIDEFKLFEILSSTIYTFFLSFLYTIALPLLAYIELRRYPKKKIFIFGIFDTILLAFFLLPVAIIQLILLFRIYRANI